MSFFRFFTILLAVGMSASLLLAQSEGVDPASRGLPRILFNDDGDDLRSPAYGLPDLWVPAGEKPLIRPVRTVGDCLGYRIEPLARTDVAGLAFCGNFGVPVWDLPPARLTALGRDPLLPIIQFWKQEGRAFFFSIDRKSTRLNSSH